MPDPAIVPRTHPCPKCGAPRLNHSSYLTCAACGVHDDDLWAYVGQDENGRCICPWDFTDECIDVDDNCPEHGADYGRSDP